jgi:hypothetical protein
MDQEREDYAELNAPPPGGISRRALARIRLACHFEGATHRRWLIVDALGLAVVALLLWASGPYPRFTKFGLIHEGMTLDEIEATVGAPPGDYSEGEASDDLAWRANPWYRENREIWITTKLVLLVEFGTDGRAIDVWVWKPHLWRGSWLEQVREWRIRNGI